MDTCHCSEDRCHHDDDIRYAEEQQAKVVTYDDLIAQDEKAALRLFKENL